MFLEAFHLTKVLFKQQFAMNFGKKTNIFVMKNIVDMMCDRFERNSKTILKLSTAISLLLEK